MKLCRKCPHRRHRSDICRYPSRLFRTPGMPPELCGCTFGIWMPEPSNERREQWIQQRAIRAFAAGARRVNSKPSIDP